MILPGLGSKVSAYVVLYLVGAKPQPVVARRLPHQKALHTQSGI